MEWIVFSIIIVFVMILDLGVFRRGAHVVKLKEAVFWSILWILVSLAFAGGLYFFNSKQDSTLFLTGYLVEKALSVDNLFLFLIIFKHFAIPREYQHKILFWGIIGAIVTRGIIIAAGISLVESFSWITYVFGAFIVYMGIKAAFVNDEEIDVSSTLYFRVIEKFCPIKWDYKGPLFFVRSQGALYLTPLFVVLLVVEISDVVFALDSVPAILSITTDVFLVFTSNLFAILGLRSLYFVLAELSEIFDYLVYAVSFILISVGVKILLKDLVHFPEWLMLSLILGSLVISILASIVMKSRYFRKTLD